MSDLAARLDVALVKVRMGNAHPKCLIPLYEVAAAQTENATQRAFFLTHAYVHALESGDDRAEALHGDLVAMGCETGRGLQPGA